MIPNGSQSFYGLHVSLHPLSDRAYDNLLSDYTILVCYVLFRLELQCIDLCRQDEVILRKPADGVGHQRHP